MKNIRMKKFVATALSCVMTTATALANVGLVINGETVHSDVPATIIDGRTLVPVRAVSENMGADVSWNNDTKTVSILKNNKSINLIIGNQNATVDNVSTALDVPPQIINGSTLVPIRFIAENFDCNVEWNNDTKTAIITTIETTQTPQTSTSASFSISSIPKYSGTPYVVVNNNVPYFNDADIPTYSFEQYSPMDSLGRCGIALANVGIDIMPTEERGSIGQVKPSGWETIRYDGVVDGNYLYNRCHLIGYQLTGENANEENLITGTRAMNVDGMLPFENMIDDYVDDTNNHVYYRVTPVFEGNNLVATGVLMEAKSVEDNGAGVMFNVFCYNAQPGISIDYATGSSTYTGENMNGKEVEFVAPTVENTVNEAPETTSPTVTTVVPQPTQPSNDTTVAPTVSYENSTYILNISSKKIHIPTCRYVDSMNEENKQGSNSTLIILNSEGYEVCSVCF